MSRLRSSEMKIPEMPREAVKHKTYIDRHKTENMKQLGDIKGRQ